MDLFGYCIRIIIKRIINHGLKEMIYSFFFYAFLSVLFVVLWGRGFWLGLPIAIGIGLYGLAYFIVHDIFIHQRFKIFRNIDNKYARGVRRAHKVHHKNINKGGGECFGMLYVPKKYFR
jgi:beta-carotene 3-hydroxylase